MREAPIPSLKLRYQGVFLVGIPLVAQLIFVAVLITLVLNLESAAGKETQAKTVIASCDSLRLEILSAYSGVVSSRVFASGVQPDLKLARINIETKLNDLEELVKDDAVAKEYVVDYVKSTERMLDLIQEIVEARDANDGTFSYSEFISDHEYFEEFSSFLLSMTRQAQKINQHYTPIVSEFQPKAAATRTALQLVIIAGVLGNTLLALFLAASFGRQTVRRLDMLMENIRLFSLREKALKPVTGKDEIAELDKEFRQIAEAKEQAEQMRRSILSMVSHDLRSPLTSLRLGLDLALDGVYGELPPKAAQLLKRSSSEIIRLVRLANALLDLDKIEDQNVELDIEEQFVATIVELSVDAVLGLSEVKAISIQKEYPEELMISCDLDRIIQVLVNFLSNATKFSPRESTVKLRVFEQDAFVKFEVCDQGPGIKLEDQPLVFQKYRQLPQDTGTQTEGSGLGLTICKALIEQHNGMIGVKSEVGKGSTFWFELPIDRGR